MHSNWPLLVFLYVGVICCYFIYSTTTVLAQFHFPVEDYMQNLSFENESLVSLPSDLISINIQNLEARAKVQAENKGE